MALRNRTTIAPLLLTYENESMYLHIDPQGCALFRKDSPEPLYQSKEPLLLAQGIMTDPETVHLVTLKTSGELCYSLISRSGTPQTSLLAKLDVRSTKYRRLFLFPQGKMIHIFYGHAHQSIPGLWHIDHRFWDGTSWHSVHMGEVVHPREPLYHVNLDSQGNIHILTMTFQGSHSLFFTNRFNGTFHIWGTPTETLKISGEAIDMAAFMTSDNVQYLFWVTKTIKGQFELRSAQQTSAHVLTSPWHPSPAPIKTFSSLCKGIGVIELNGVLWLLARTNEEILMQNDGMGWKSVASHSPVRRSLQWVHKGDRNSHQTYWLEDQTERRTPAFYRELGLNPRRQNSFSPLPATTVPFNPPAATAAPPPVPAFYPDVVSPNSYPLPSVTIPQNEVKNEIKTPKPSETIRPQVLRPDPCALETFNSPFPIEIINQTEVPKVRETPEIIEEPAKAPEVPQVSNSSEITEASVIPDVSDDSEVIGVSTIPDIPNIPDDSEVIGVSTIPDIPNIPDDSEVIGVSTIPDIPDIPDDSEVIGVSTIPDIPNIPDDSEVIGVSTIPDIPNIPDDSEVIGVSTIPDIPDIPDDSEVIGVSTIPDIPNIPDDSEVIGVSTIPDIPDDSEAPKTPNNDLEEIAMSQSSVENAKLERLITTVTHLEEENTNMSLILHNMLSKFDQILEVLVANSFQAKQETVISEVTETPFDELEPVKEAMANLEKETQSLSQVMRIMLNKQEENDSSLENIEVKISRLQEEQKDPKTKGGFWNKWIT